ncbi:MAG TPA: hypothetical protein VGX28_10460 [Frankiaceae bacterium]|nr:hypothetical protein [Frankiaceae bacterium]
MGPKLVAIGVAVALGGGVGMLGVRHLDDSRPVTIDEAVERFRSASPTPGAPGASPTAVPTATASGATPGTSPGSTAAPGTSPRPGATSAPGVTPGPGGPAAEPPADPDNRTPAGVYAYATTGYETADAGVPRARHDYPRETSLTVRHVPCGSSVRWDANEDRWDDVSVCAASDHTKVTAYKSFHRFFGQSETRDYRCYGTSYLRPPPGVRRWSFDCTTADAKAATVATVVGVETVGGTRALHVHYDTTLTGTNRGTNPQDFWIALDGPYVVRQASRVDAEVVTPWGTITYHEEYDLVLKSRTPRR